jgi:hypothetical protein
MRRTALLAGFSAATLLTGMTLAHAGNGPKGNGTLACANNGTGGSGYTVTWNPTSVFPPNHKMVTGTLSYSPPANDTTDTQQLTITSITSDELLPDGSEMNGSGNTLVDSSWDTGTASGTGTVTRGFQIRAERSGQGDGRTYTINYTAKSDPGAPLGTGVSNNCDGSVDVNVPHDMGGGNDK